MTKLTEKEKEQMNIDEYLLNETALCPKSFDFVADRYWQTKKKERASEN